MKTITIIRHGKPEFELNGRVCAHDLQHIIQRYNRAGLAEQPAETTKQIAQQCCVVICSDFARSIESAIALGFEEIHLSSPLFREVAVPHFNTGSFKMSVSSWSLLLRLLSLFGYSNNGESPKMAKLRAKQAAQVLIDKAIKHESVLLVGHGFINYFIAQELLLNNWVGPTKPGKNHWDFGIYEYNRA